MHLSFLPALIIFAGLVHGEATDTWKMPLVASLALVASTTNSGGSVFTFGKFYPFYTREKRRNDLKNPR